MPRSKVRARHGYGPKALFFGAIFPHLCKNAERVAGAFLGSACEQWINGECFYALLNSHRSLWVRPEKYKRDLVLFEDEEAEEANEPALIIESKVIYSSEGANTQRARLRKLMRQLEHAEQTYPNTPAVGIVTRFYWEWRAESDKHWTVPRARQIRRGEPELVYSHAVRGLENAFQHSRRHLKTSANKSQRFVNVSLGRYRYRVDASIEVVRLRRG
jgi:hypothetical protein